MIWRSLKWQAQRKNSQEQIFCSSFTCVIHAIPALSVKKEEEVERADSPRSFHEQNGKEEEKLSKSAYPLSFKRDGETNKQRELSWAALSARCDSLSTLWFCSGGCVRLRQVTDKAMMRWLLSITHCHNTAQCAVFKPSGQHQCFWKHTVASHNACLYV